MLYDPKTNKWSALPSMLEHRGRLDIAVVDGKVYAVGGSSGNKELMTAEVYDSRTGAVKWQRVPSCRLPRASCGQFSCRYLSWFILWIRYSVFFALGFFVLNSLSQVLDYFTSWWSSINLFNVLGVCALDGKIYCIGGWDGQRGFKDCEVFDVEKQKWADISPLSIGEFMKRNDPEYERGGYLEFCFSRILRRNKKSSNHEETLVADKLCNLFPSSRFRRIGAPFLWLGGGCHFPIKFLLNSLKAQIPSLFLKWGFVFICAII